MKPKQILELEDYWGIEIWAGNYRIDSNGEITNLTLIDKQISDLDPIKELIYLKDLRLLHHKITDISPLRNLTRLAILDLTGNQIIDVNPLKKLDELQILFLTNNQISDIRPLRNLIERGIQVKYSSKNDAYCINFFNNPLPPALIEAIHQGNKAVLDYLDNLEKEESKGTRPLNEAKMVIIGEPDAGKTTLMNYLLGKPFTETKTTQGIRIEPWEIADESGMPYRINIWDFGGQEIQSTVHKFFLTQETLYVVVLNARKDEQPDKYLEQIRSYAPNSPVIIVINRMDENNGSIDESRLRAEYRTETGESMIRDVYKTSIRKVHEQNDPFFLPAVRALEASIIRELLLMPNIRQIVPQNYFEVKNYLESRFFKDEPYITYERYEAICREKNLEKESDESLLMILDRLGTVRYFDKLSLNHLQILNPEWLSDGVYRILTSEYTHQRNGVISEKDFNRILYKTDAHTFQYPKQHYGYLIEMIRRFYLGYVNPDTHEIFIPQAFQSDYPIGFQPEDFKKEALHFFFRYETHIPAGAISSFIARTFGQVRGHFYWQKGIVIERNEADEIQTALVMQTDTRNRIDIWVQGTHRREFFIEIRQLFREFHERYPGLKVDEMIGLDTRYDTSVKYRVLIAQKHKGKIEYTDEEGNDYNIDRLLGMFETQDDTKKVIQQTFNINGNYYEIHGANKVIIQQAGEIAEEFENIKRELTEANQAQIQSLIDLLAELQKAESLKKAKGVLAQLKETAKNLPKIASEEAVKWATKTALDGVSFKEKFDSLQQRIVNLLQDNSFQDFIKPDNWG
ncbi:COR domain-containing protein [Runella zeae]|uniref:COR domain-containing protein n=1 Tax=Runella zeae TaxID=94255 RepID=UPI00048F71F4|nr:COR domain-containing protein [Runella zeae]